MIQSDAMPSNTIYGTIWPGVLLQGRQSWKRALLTTAEDNTKPRHCLLALFKSQHPEPQHLMSPCFFWCSFVYIIPQERKSNICLCYPLCEWGPRSQTPGPLSLRERPWCNVITRQQQITTTEEEFDSVLLLFCLVDWTPPWHVAFTPQTQCLHVKCWCKQKWDGSEWG